MGRQEAIEWPAAGLADERENFGRCPALLGHVVEGSISDGGLSVGGDVVADVGVVRGELPGVSSGGFDLFGLEGDDIPAIPFVAALSANDDSVVWLSGAARSGDLVEQRPAVQIDLDRRRRVLGIHDQRIQQAHIGLHHVAAIAHLFTEFVARVNDGLARPRREVVADAVRESRLYLVLIEEIEVSVGPVINHQRPSVGVDHLALPEPPPEIPSPFLGPVDRLPVAVQHRALDAVYHQRCSSWLQWGIGNFSTVERVSTSHVVAHERRVRVMPGRCQHRRRRALAQLREGRHHQIPRPALCGVPAPGLRRR
ncbi:hypothetical protein, partial [Candidatus Accumulibacter vicinus]|uniref:hypothetical protein n=1 Tax=Candidatus Accumulibacter vicinus TaxID=2954382 RepID=UPI00235B5B65